MHPHPDPDYHQNLVDWSLDYVQPFGKLSKFDKVFLSNPFNRHTQVKT